MYSCQSKELALTNLVDEIPLIGGQTGQKKDEIHSGNKIGRRTQTSLPRRMMGLATKQRIASSGRGGRGGGGGGRGEGVTQIQK